MRASCRICGSEAAHAELHPREMMFGTQERFDYFQCAECGCLQIASVPEDLGRHYPSNYYSFGAGQAKLEPGWRKWLKAQRVHSALEGQGVVDRLLAPIIYVPPDVRLWTTELGLKQSSRILDVGCGGGDLLRSMARVGFESLLGVDPFIAADISYPDGVRILKRPLGEMSGEFDAVMLNHSFEHMPEPRAILTEVKRLLAPGGTALLRIPLCSSAAFRLYGADWVQLDAPRHLFLHTEGSMRRLAQHAGFTVERVVYDSTAFQFWGSEQYRRDIALFAPNSRAVTAERSVFSRAELDAWEARARELNAQADGDQAGFVLRVA